VVALAALVMAATGCSGTTIVEPGSTAPPFAATTSPTPSTTSPPDLPDLRGFIEQLTTALTRADVEALVATLHPAARELYGLERCRDFVGDITPAEPVLTPEREEPARLEVHRDGHLVVVESGWQMHLDDTGTALFPSGLVVGVDEDGTLRWFPDCGRVLLTVDPGGLIVITIDGDTFSAPFDTPDSWRVEAAASASCEVVLHDLDSGTVESIGRDDASFLVQLAGRGRFRIQSIGCDRVTVRENTAET
jgi:hypothetical protein